MLPTALNTRKATGAEAVAGVAVELPEILPQQFDAPRLRQGDAAEQALVEFIKADDPGYKKNPGRKAAKTKAKGKVAAEAPAAAATEPAATAAPEVKS